MLTREAGTYRGTWAEIVDVGSRIPGDAVVELRVLVPAEPETQNEESSSVPTSLYERFHDLIGTVRGSPADLAARDEEYLQKTAFGETRDRLLGFPSISVPVSRAMNCRL